MRFLAVFIGATFFVLSLMSFALVPGTGELFGTFAVNPGHNLVHLVVGLLGLGAFFVGGSRRYLQGVGIFYLVLTALGVIPGVNSNVILVSLIHLNLADNLLHLVVGLIAAFVGFLPQATQTPTLETGA